MLEQYSDSDLQKELERRNHKKISDKLPQPGLSVAIDWSPLHDVATEYVSDFIKNKGFTDDEDLKQGLLETLLETVYGPDIWDRLNELDSEFEEERDW
jgi:hypothetical protein